MQIPLRITWRQMSSSPALEEHLRERVQSLKQFHDGIVDCEVVISSPAGRHQHGAPFGVRMLVTVPDGVLNVSNDGTPDASHSDAYVAVRDAFEAMERMLRRHNDDRHRWRARASIRRDDGRRQQGIGSQRE